MPHVTMLHCFYLGIDAAVAGQSCNNPCIYIYIYASKNHVQHLTDLHSQQVKHLTSSDVLYFLMSAHFSKHTIHTESM